MSGVQAALTTCIESKQILEDAKIWIFGNGEPTLRAKSRIPTPSPWTGLWGVFLRSISGSDGLVRVVNVKTSTGILKRAITKVVPLPIPVDPATVEGRTIEAHFTIS
ncbi:hypothetical protein TNCV_4393871 [Trichonephila clavipes]|nr:hypothetical protein TNCV_4393871 [Trichonephila clavipes]